VEEGLHVDADLLVVAVDLCPGGWFAAGSWAVDAGEDGGDDLVAQCEQAGDGAGGWGWYAVAAGPAGFVDQLFAAEFAEVVGGLAGGVGGGAESGGLGGEVGDSESGWGCGQREGGG